MEKEINYAYSHTKRRPSTSFKNGIFKYLFIYNPHDDWYMRPKYTGCPRRNVPDFGRVFLMLKYTDITQNTYVQS
jgi:hypothetical protein